MEYRGHIASGCDSLFQNETVVPDLDQLQSKFWGTLAGNDVRCQGFRNPFLEKKNWGAEIRPNIIPVFGVRVRVNYTSSSELIQMISTWQPRLCTTMHARITLVAIDYITWAIIA